MADPGSLYTQTNDPAGNVVQAFERDARGALDAGRLVRDRRRRARRRSAGARAPSSSSGDEATVYAVNAGSNTRLRAARHALGARARGRRRVRRQRARERRRAPRPRVRAQQRRHAERDARSARAVTARWRRSPAARRELPGALGAAQVSVAPDGSALVVSERLSNRLETLPLDDAGRPGAPVVTASSGAVPFGFAFGHRGDVIVSEAGASTVSSYRLGAGGLDVDHGLAAGRLRRRLLGRRLAERQARLHGQRRRDDQRLRGRRRRRPDAARHHADAVPARPRVLAQRPLPVRGQPDRPRSPATASPPTARSSRSRACPPPRA